MSAGKAIEVLQQQDEFDLLREVERWLLQAGLLPMEAHILARRFYPYVRDSSAGLLRTIYDAVQIDGLTVDQIREGLDFARERGWDG